MSDSPAPFIDLVWHRLDFRLRCTRTAPRHADSLLGVVESLVKSTTRRAPGVRVVFRLPGYTLNQLRSAQGRHYDVQLRLFGHESNAACWQQVFAEHCATVLYNFELDSLGPLQQRRFSDIGIPACGSEVALEFLTPFAFTPLGKTPTRLDHDTFLDRIAARFQTLFGGDWSSQVRTAGAAVELLPYYWRFERTTRSSRSQPGQQQWLKGCVGTLYLKGDLAPLLPFLLLAEETQLGSRLTFGQGYFRLQIPGPAYFQTRLTDTKRIRSAVDNMLERHDQAIVTLAEAGFDSEAALCEDIRRIVASGDFQPEPHSAFLLAREGKRARLVERLSAEGLALHQHLHSLLADVLDRLFDDAAVGYRKGYSLATAAERIQQALADGYDTVVRADIQDFFPSVRLDRLEQLLDGLLPQADRILRQLLRACLHTGYQMSGEFHPRGAGLATGSPLSPLLANLYLDRLDKTLIAAGAFLVRYADDFVILAKGGDEAERLLALAQDTLEQIGLALHPEKTLLQSVETGFRFLGMDFGPDAETVAADPPLRKPLYLTESGCFLGVSGDALDIRRKGSVVETLPLHRISEVIVLGYVSLSSTLVRRCSEQRIPISLTLSNGYHISTIAPASRRYHETGYRQALKFAALQTHEHLAIAKEFAAGKLNAYRAFFRQRYRPGSSELSRALERSITDIHSAAETQEVRGIEGAAARRCFAELNQLIQDPAFHIEKRIRKNPDPINSLLNFGYHLLFTRINATVRATGLNPYLGFLHSPTNRYESLVYDIEELFRARIDRLIVRVLNLRIITSQDFVQTERGNRLTREAVKRFVHQFEREMASTRRNGGIPLGQAIHAQVICLREYFVANRPLLFFSGGDEP